MESKLYPMKLLGVTRSPIWGGTRLCRAYGKASNAAPVGESWELTVRHDAVCLVENGAYAGERLDALIDRLAQALTGGAFGSSDFPLLIKLIDADAPLSVQVHPDDPYAARVERDRGKSELWYIVEAEEGAEIIFGLCDGVDSDGFAKALADGTLKSVLKHQPVRAGEAYFIPAGMAHSIGRGILIAEIQQNCDLTYRIYDYGRRDANGKLRELHIEKALEVVRPFTDAEINAMRYARACREERGGELLAASEFFRVKKLTLDGEVQKVSRMGVMQHLLCLSDGLELQCDGVSYETRKGDSWLIPAALDGVSLVGAGCAIVSSVC